MKAREIELTRPGFTHSYKTTLRAVIEQASSRAGMSVSEVRRRVRMLDILESCNDDGVFRISDSQHTHLKKLIDAYPWQAANSHIEGLIDDVINAEEVDMEVVNREPADFTMA